MNLMIGWVGTSIKGEGAAARGMNDKTSKGNLEYLWIDAGLLPHWET